MAGELGMNFLIGAAIIYFLAWIGFTAVFPHAYPRIFIPLDFLFGQELRR